MKEFFKVKISNYDSVKPVRPPKLATAGRAGRFNKMNAKSLIQKINPENPYTTETRLTDESQSQDESSMFEARKQFSSTFHCGKQTLDDSSPLQNPLSNFRRMPRRVLQSQSTNQLLEPPKTAMRMGETMS